MPYIPQFNKISLQEQAYAPTLMRQQHDEAVAKQMELADALKFDYLKQDAPILEPVLNKYSEDIQKVSSDLAKQGFTQDTKSKLLGLRSQYTTDDKIRQVKKNYSDAMQGWEETKKALIQRGASGDLINKQKAAYFGAYKGGFDDEGFKQDFTAGRTSGVYDITEDAKRAMTGLGSTGSVVGSSGSSIVEKTGIGADKRPFTYFEVTDNKTGQVIKNADQRAAVEAYLRAEYGDESTDRGLYAKIAGLTPEHIQNAISNVSASMAENRYAQLPQRDTNISGMARGAIADLTVQRSPLDLSAYGIQPEGLNQAKLTNSAQLESDALELAKKSGLKVNSLEELEELASKGSFGKIGSNEYGTQRSQESIEKIGSAATQQYLRSIREKNKDIGSSTVARDVMDKLDQKVKTSPEYAKPSFNIDLLTFAHPKGIDYVNTLSNQLNKVVALPEVQEKFSPATNKDENNFEKVKDYSSIRVVGVTPNLERGAKTPIIIDFVGEDKDSKPVYFKKYLRKDPKMIGLEDPLESSIYDYLKEVDSTGSFRNNYEFMTNTKEYIDNSKQLMSPVAYSNFINNSYKLIKQQLSPEEFKQFEVENEGLLTNKK